jgi:kinesin family member 20
VKKTLSIIPFRHSKLTEMLMDYFVGDSRAVMFSPATVIAADNDL